MIDNAMQHMSRASVSSPISKTWCACWINLKNRAMITKKLPDDDDALEDALYALVSRSDRETVQSYLDKMDKELFQSPIPLASQNRKGIVKRLKAKPSGYPAHFNEKPWDDRMNCHRFEDETSEQWQRFIHSYTGKHHRDPKQFRENVSTTMRATAAVVQKCQMDSFLSGNAKKLKEVVREFFKKDYEGMYDMENCLARGTSFLIAENYLLTAAHNLADENGWIDDKDLVYVFDYRYEGDKFGRDIAPNGDSIRAYQGKKILYPMRPHDDWMLVELTTPYHNATMQELIERPKLNLSRDPAHLKKCTALYAMGFPFGLAMKVVLVGHYVRRLMDDRFAVNLDFYHGNSGSPVLSLESNEVVGLFVAGFPDMEETTDKVRLRQYNYNLIGQGTGGEHCQHIGQIIDRIDALIATPNP